MFTSLKVVGGVALTFVLLLVLVTQWPKPVNAAAVATVRQVQVPVSTKKNPLVITKVTLGDTIVQLGRMVAPTEELTTPFLAGVDWIQNLNIYLYNRTNRKIVFAEIVLYFPETGDGRTQPMYAVTLHLGRIPPSASAENTFRNHSNGTQWGHRFLADSAPCTRDVPANSANRSGAQLS